MKFRVLSAAQIEATESALWYEEKQPGLADEFFTDVESCFHRIRENPVGFPRLEHYLGAYDIRRCLLNRFPYAVIFHLVRDEILVVAVAHTRRRPLYWLSRV